MDTLDKRIITRLQQGFPLCHKPYRAIAEELGTTEATLMAHLETLLDNKTLTRFGPMYNADAMGGAFTLAAMIVPENKVTQVAEIVNYFPEVAHNYERDHQFNIWFVLATDCPEAIASTIEKIESATGYKVYNMPKQEEYYVGLHLPV